MKKIALITAAMMFGIGLIALPAEAAPTNYKPAETVYGFDTLPATAVYPVIDSKGNMHFVDVWVSDTYKWRHIIQDGSIFIRPINSRAIIHYDWKPYDGLVAHTVNAQARFFPLTCGTPCNVYSKVLDWAGPATNTHNHVFGIYPEQFSDTRWLRNTSKVTVRLPPGQTFWCGCRGTKTAWDGKNTYTFTMTTSYFK